MTSTYDVIVDSQYVQTIERRINRKLTQEEREWHVEMREKNAGAGWGFSQFFPNADILSFYRTPLKEDLKNLGLERKFGSSKFVGEGVEVEANRGFRTKNQNIRKKGYPHEKYLYSEPSAYVRAIDEETARPVIEAFYRNQKYR